MSHGLKLTSKAVPAVRRRRKSGDKSAMPDAMAPIAAKAKQRLRGRHLNPGVAVEIEKVSEYGYRLASPHSDHDSWEAMICDALGTRSISTAKTFVYSLTQLCSQTFCPSETGGEWCPDEFELNMVLNIATSIKPRNEMEAALAAQMTAVHMMTMKMAAQALEGYGADLRAAALSAKLARTFTLQWEALMRHRGKRRTVRQAITVSQEKHIHNHHHQHVHIEGGGQENGDQPHATMESGIVGNGGGDTLPCSDASEGVLPVSRSERDEGLPNARRQRLRSAAGSR